MYYTLGIHPLDIDPMAHVQIKPYYFEPSWVISQCVIPGCNTNTLRTNHLEGFPHWTHVKKVTPPSEEEYCHTCDANPTSVPALASKHFCAIRGCLLRRCGRGKDKWNTQTPKWSGASKHTFVGQFSLQVSQPRKTTWNRKEGLATATAHPARSYSTNAMSSALASSLAMASENRSAQMSVVHHRNCDIPSACCVLPSGRACFRFCKVGCKPIPAPKQPAATQTGSSLPAPKHLHGSRAVDLEIAGQACAAMMTGCNRLPCPKCELNPACPASACCVPPFNRSCLNHLPERPAFFGVKEPKPPFA